MVSLRLTMGVTLRQIKQQVTTLLLSLCLPRSERIGINIVRLSSGIKR